MKYSSRNYYRDSLEKEVEKTIKKLDDDNSKKTCFCVKIKKWFVGLFKK